MPFPTIVYIEDDANSTEIMRLLLLEALSYPPENVLLLADSSDFMEQIEQLATPPDLFLLDIHVTPFGGFDILAMLRADPRYCHVPVVALTASVMNEEVNKLRHAGFNSVIAKPIDIDLMPVFLERILTGENIWHISA